MIPKIIHYCWFGHGEKSKLINKCIHSWKLYLPDYKIIEWNEDNFNVNEIVFTQEAYEKHKWAFVSDYARLYALNKFGGIYLDTDVELFKNLDCFLENNFFLGYESNDYPGTAIIGSSLQNIILEELIIYYKNQRFVLENGKYNILPNPWIFAKILKDKGIILDGKERKSAIITLYDQLLFYPNNIGLIWNKKHRRTFAIHHCEQTWRDEEIRDFSKLKYRVRRYFVKILQNMIGTETLGKIKHFIKK